MKYWFKNVADNIYIYPKSAPRNLILQIRTSDCNSAPEYNNPDHMSDEIIYNLENKDTFFIKNNKGYKIYYKGRFVGKCKSLETFQGYRVYKNDKEAKENEEVK